MRTSPWRPTAAWLGATGLAAAVALAGVVTGRPDAVALVVPVVVAAALGAARRTKADAAGHPEPSSPVSLDRLPDAPAGHHLARLRAPAGHDVRLRVSVPRHRPAHALLPAGATATADVFSARTGPLELFRLDWAGVADGFETVPTTRRADRVVVEPGVGTLDALPLPDHLVGLTGAHPSRRRGDGDELHDVAPFRSGDRLPRIDWRVTARRGTSDPRIGTQLYVRRTQAPAEAVVMIVLDSRDDVGVDVRTWSGGRPGADTEPTSLDVARRAAATLARAYLEQGDRVGLADLGTRRRAIAPGGGRRHLQRVTHALALAAPEGEPARLRRAPQVPTGALVVIASTFLDDEAAAAAQLWAAAGHRVLAVDVLTTPHLADLPPAEVLAARLVLAERAARLRRLGAAGIAVVAWHAASAAGAGDDLASARAEIAVLSRRPRGAR
ncbi:DUF58 domain-containing protein [Serinibacter arcticus]|uniref:DUF58 domain-containing protein n=1 Tax=Serinibacter arcticus TaxID=1655435 RepID=A0A4Z1E9N3_9MICO|nr:DUF58 domain-containing protein [Serinibacter arcticus]TGO06151.1 protein of unknown function DUF58 [Serinibacter arcticus]